MLFSFLSSAGVLLDPLSTAKVYLQIFGSFGEALVWEFVRLRPLVLL